jgi:hypothetical protein
MDLSSSEANTSKLWGPDDELLKIWIYETKSNI